MSVLKGLDASSFTRTVLATARNRLLSETFGQLQLLNSAYREGHISAASDVELAVPPAHSPIIFELVKLIMVIFLEILRI